MHSETRVFKPGDKVRYNGKGGSFVENTTKGILNDRILTVKNFLMVEHGDFNMGILTFEEINDREIYGGIASFLFDLDNDRKNRIQNLNL